MTKKEMFIIGGVAATMGILMYVTGRAPFVAADPTIPRSKKWLVQTLPWTDEMVVERYSTDDVGGTLFYTGQPVSRISRNGGVPRTDMERAMNHYSISPEQYMTCPQCYPLPPRGTGIYRN